MSTLVYLVNYPHTVFHGFVNLHNLPPTTRDFATFQDSNADLKIAIVEYDYRTVLPPTQIIEQLESLSFADQVIFVSIEGTSEIEIIIRKLDRLNYTFFLGFIPSFEIKHASVHYDMYWLKSTASYYLNDYKSFDLKIDTTSKKEIPFEVLYGTEKPHRRFVKDYINGNPNFLESTFLARGSVFNESYGDSSEIFWEEGVSVYPGRANVEYRGNKMVGSQVLPFKVYNKTAYSIICETIYTNPFVFPTEKTAKPMIAARLFIIIGVKGFLQGLHKLGFRTFDGIIDESYDSISDNHLRWKTAMDQAMKLVQMDQEEVIERCAPIFAHNQDQLIKLQFPYFMLDRYLEDYISRNPSDAQE